MSRAQLFEVDGLNPPPQRISKLSLRNRRSIAAKKKDNMLQKNGSKRSVFATVGTGGSFGSASLRQEIGLGDARQIESIEVTWPKPGVPKSIYTNIPLDGAIKLTEGVSTAETVSLGKLKFKV
jgi:hypothetical protein